MGSIDVFDAFKLHSLFLYFSRRGEKHNKFTVQLRTTAPNGLLLWSNQHGANLQGDFLAVALVDGFPQLSFNLGKKQRTTTVVGKVRELLGCSNVLDNKRRLQVHLPISKRQW